VVVCLAVHCSLKGIICRLLVQCHCNVTHFSRYQHVQAHRVNSFCSCSFCQLFAVQRNSSALSTHTMHLFLLIFHPNICKHPFRILEATSNNKSVQILGCTRSHGLFFPEKDVFIPTDEASEPTTSLEL
jgi:hypothetical protein